MLPLYNVCVCLSVRTSKHFIIIIITGIIILNQVAMFCWPAGGVCPAVEEGRDHPGRGGEGHQLCGYQDIYSACKYQGLNDHQFCWLQWRTLAHPGAPYACFFFKGWMSPTLYRYVIPFDEEDLIIMKKDKTTIILVTVFYVCSVVHILRSCNDKLNLY